MKLEACRLVANALDDVTLGVNARLASVPRDGSDAVPPDLALIDDETRNPFAARGQMPEDDDQYPCLLVGLMDQGNTLDPHQKTGVRDGSVQLLVRYGARQVDSARGAQDAYYTFRAVERCLTAWINGDPATREMNDVAVWYAERCDIVPLWEPVGDKIVTGGMILSYRLRDLDP